MNIALRVSGSYHNSIRSWSLLCIISDSLVCYPIQRTLIVEAKITSMEDVVRFGSSGKVVQRSQIAYHESVPPILLPVAFTHTSNVCNTKDPCSTGLNDTTVVWEESLSAWYWAA